MSLILQLLAMFVLLIPIQSWSLLWLVAYFNLVISSVKMAFKSTRENILAIIVLILSFYKTDA